MLKKRTAFSVLGLCFTLAIGCFFIWEGAIRYRPYKYYVRNPSSMEERRTLITRLEQELAEMQKVALDYGIATANDADSLWPLDRLLIVAAIEKYYLKVGRFPQDIESLLGMQFLSDLAIKERAEIVVASDHWEVRTRERKYVFALGN